MNYIKQFENFDKSSAVYYRTREYKMKGATFTVSEPIYVDKIIRVDQDFPKDPITLIVYELNGKIESEDNRSPYYDLSTKPAKYDVSDKFLPYWADVTEDLPFGANKKPTTYYNCQLMTYKPNNYYVFYDHKTGREHKIAMNSHSYEPVKAA